MPPKERAVDRGSRLARHDLVAVGADLRSARLSSALTLAEVGRAVGMSQSQVGRIERARHTAVTVNQLARIGAAVGLDVRTRTFPGPAPLRDAGHLALIARFRQHLHPHLRLRLEVPIAGTTGDLRAWDGVIGGLDGGPGSNMPAEFDTRLHDFQAQLRRLMLKCRDSNEPHVLWIVAGTRGNRRSVAAARTFIADAFPIRSRAALRDLRAGRHPGASALILV